MPDFPANPKPEYPIEELPQIPEVLISRHRDGSEQRRLKGAGDGGQFHLRFGASMPITKDQRDGILDHFSASHGTLDAFSWTHPETGSIFTARYLEPPSFQLVGYNAYTGELRLKVVTA